MSRPPFEAVSISTADAFNPRPIRAQRLRMALDFAVASLAAIILLAITGFSPRVFVDGDTNWHVGAGTWILDHHLVPRTDPFSFTYAGKPWLAHEWLSEVLMTLAWRAAGWSGVVLLIGAAAGASYAMIAGELRRWLGPVSQIIGLGLSFACLQPFLYARPHILALPLLVFWTIGLLAARREGRAPDWRMLPLMVLWANLHASFIFGLALIGPFALEALVEAKASDKLRALTSWAIFGVAALVLSMITPHGIDGLIFPFMVLGMKVLPNILEWRAAVFQRPTLFEAAVLGTLFLGLWRGVKVPIFRLILLLGLTHMALQHVRQQAILSALAPLILAEPFGRALNPAREGPRPTPSYTDPFLRPFIAAALVLALCVGLVRLANPLVRQDNENVPVSALAHVPADIRKLPVFNEYAFGGYLIFNGVKPYIDGRADMYGDDFVREYLVVLGANQPDVNQTLSRWHIRWTILSPRSRLVALLDRSPGWHRLYADRWAVVHVADATPPSPPPPPARQGPAA